MDRENIAFVRTKEIPPGSGNYYRYLVRNKREGNHVRQKVLQYLGPAGGASDTSFDRSEIPEKYRDELGTTEREGGRYCG